jgi:hypothetical protein
MPATLSAIVGNTATVPLEYAGLTINITYYPGRITEKVFAKLQKMSQDNGDVISSIIDGFGSVNDIIVSLVKSWDFYEDDAATVTYPLNDARLSELPFDFRSAVVKAVLGDMRPNASEATAQTLS